MMVLIFIIIPLVSMMVAGVISGWVFKLFPKTFGRRYPFIHPKDALLRGAIMFFVWAVICSGVFYFATWVY